MAYDTIKTGIVGRLKGLGLTESTEAFDFENASSREYGLTFILNCLSGAMDEESSETIIDRFYDFQEWELKIAFKKSAQSDVINKDNAHRKKDTILADIDDPANWSSFARILKYKSWELTESPDYFLLTINLTIQDTYTY